MKTCQSIFHGTILSLFVVSGIGLVSDMVLFIGVGVGMILGYPSGIWVNLWVSVFVLALTGVFLGGICHLACRLFTQPDEAAAHPGERGIGKVIQIKRDQSAGTD